jgi:hypothetical protein
MSARSFNYVKWSFIVALAGSIAAVIAIPGLREFVCGLSNICPVQQKEVELITKSEGGEPLADVQVQFIGIGAPETKSTDSNGYVKANISNKGDVNVGLNKSGYPAQNFTINLANDQNTVRVIRLTKLGQPSVTSFSTISAVPSSPPVEEIKWSDNASNLVAKVGQDFMYLCPPNGTIGNVQGADFYSSISSICSSAVHAGIINTKDGGKVQIRIRPGEKFYNGTSRNGVTSTRSGISDGSFTFLDSGGQPISSEQIEILDWDDRASSIKGKLGQDFTYLCPQNGTVDNNIYGADSYTINSSICGSAVHAGIINAKDGGKVQIRVQPGEKFYNGTFRNGVTSKRYENDDWSFIFIK